MTKNTLTVSALIPTRNAAGWLPRQLEALHAQSAPIAEIVVIDSQSEDDTRAIAATDPLCRVISVAKADFDHGATRDLAARACQSDCLWFLTQDAIPADEHCLAALLDAVEEEGVAAAYGRQLAPRDASRVEQLNRQFNYPAQRFTRDASDIPALQVRAFFMSNTCCLYRREAYLACGGFQHQLPTNEDLLMAATFLHRGYKTAYCAQARVWHGHRMTLGQWYRRSFDIGAFMEMYSDRLDRVGAYGEGKKYAAVLLGQLLKEGRLPSAARFAFLCAVRLLGDRAGHRYSRLSPRAILRSTQNPAFWQRYLSGKPASHAIDSVQ